MEYCFLCYNLPMEFIEQLKKNNLLHPEMDILDVGCGNGWLFRRLVDHNPGRTYDAVDTLDKLDPSVNRSQ